MLNKALPGTLRAVKRGPNSKPVGRYIDRKKRRIVIFVVVGAIAMFVVAAALLRLLLFTNNNNGGRMTMMIRGGGSSVTASRLLSGPSSTCGNANKIQICSHQILHAPPPLSSSSSLLTSSRPPPPDGSIQAMQSLWDIGNIRCFDVDVVTLVDGTLLASHPLRFAAAVGNDASASKLPSEYTLQQVRDAGVDEIGFPILQTILETFATLVKTSGGGEGGAFFIHHHGGNNNNNKNNNKKKKDSIPQLYGPLLNLDLKGPNLTLQHLRGIEDIVKSLGITENVVVCATALGDGEVGPGVDILSVLGGGGAGNDEGSSLPLGLVLRDRVEKDNDYERIQSLVTSSSYKTSIKSLVPSNKFDSKYFAKVATLGLPITAWTVDDEAGLAHAIESGLSAVISNYPMALNEKLFEIRRNCR